MNWHKKGKTNGIFLNHQSFFRFQDFVILHFKDDSQLCYKIYNKKLFDIPFCFMQYV